MPPGRLITILADQLKVDQRQFWQVLRTVEPAGRVLLDEARTSSQDG